MIKYIKLEKQYDTIFKEIKIPYSALDMMDHYKDVYKTITSVNGQNINDLVGYVDCKMNQDLFMIKPTDKRV